MQAAVMGMLALNLGLLVVIAWKALRNGRSPGRRLPGPPGEMARSPAVAEPVARDRPALATTGTSDDGHAEPLALPGAGSDGERESRLARYSEAILRSAMDGFFMLGEGGEVLEVNDALCRMTGYEAAELKRMRISDLEVPQAPGSRGQPSTPTGLHQFAAAYRHKDGHAVRLETSILVLREGGRKFLVGFARDVTEQCRAEQALLESEQRYRTLFEQSRDAIYMASRDGTVIDVNPAALKLFGCTRQEIIGRRIEDFYADPAQHARFLREVQADDGLRDWPLRLRRSGGEVIECLLTSWVRRDGQGAVLGYEGILRDVTEQKRAAERRRQIEIQMQRAQKWESLGLLAGGVAHDFNNFLVGVLCNASLALERCGDDRELRAYLQKIINASRRASDLTRQMLAYAGRSSYDLHPLDLNALLREMVDFMRAALPRTVRLEIQLEPDLPLMQGDGGQIQQVAMNLLLNAAEATGPRGGSVSLKTQTRILSAEEVAGFEVQERLAPGAYVCLEVTDTGHGMSPETLARIFDPFFSTKFAGRGLGLASVLGIVRGHRGGIRVQSRPGVGTTFTVLFPIASLPGLSDHSPAPQAVRQSLANACILVIDDQEDVRDVLRDLLRRAGATVLTADSGESGIELFRQRMDQIDLVLLDMTMPGLDGREVCERLLALRPDVRILLSSGCAEHTALEAGADRRVAGFIHKPFTAEALTAAIGAALSRVPSAPVSPAGQAGPTA